MRRGESKNTFSLSVMIEITGRLATMMRPDTDIHERSGYEIPFLVFRELA